MNRDLRHSSKFNSEVPQKQCRSRERGGPECIEPRPQHRLGKPRLRVPAHELATRARFRITPTGARAWRTRTHNMQRHLSKRGALSGVPKGNIAADDVRPRLQRCKQPGLHDEAVLVQRPQPPVHRRSHCNLQHAVRTFHFFFCCSPPRKQICPRCQRVCPACARRVGPRGAGGARMLDVRRRADDNAAAIRAMMEDVRCVGAGWRARGRGASTCLVCGGGGGRPCGATVSGVRDCVCGACGRSRVLRGARAQPRRRRGGRGARARARRVDLRRRVLVRLRRAARGRSRGAGCGVPCSRITRCDGARCGRGFLAR